MSLETRIEKLEEKMKEHEPATVEARIASLEWLKDTKLDTPKDVRDLMQKTFRHLAAGDIDNKMAATILQIAKPAMRVMPVEAFDDRKTDSAEHAKAVLALDPRFRVRLRSDDGVKRRQ